MLFNLLLWLLLLYNISYVGKGEFLLIEAEIEEDNLWLSEENEGGIFYFLILD
jgi:hypothetical protein